MEVQKIIGDECDCGECQQHLPGLAEIPGLLPQEPVQQTLPGFKTIPLHVQDIPQYTRTRTFVFEDGNFLCKCDSEEAAERVLSAMSGAAAADYNVRLLAQLK